MYGIGRERVRQLLEREGVSVQALPDRNEQRRRRRLDLYRTLAPTMEAMWRHGWGFEDIARALGVPRRAVRRFVVERVPPDERASRRHEKLRSHRLPDERVIHALNEAARILGRTPGRAAYDGLRRDGRIEGPSGAAIAYRWGGWAIACELAGLRPNAQPPKLGLPTYSEDDYRAALTRVAEMLGGRPTQVQYRAMRRVGDPTAQAIALRYGGWLNARAEVLGDRVQDPPAAFAGANAGSDH